MFNQLSSQNQFATKKSSSIFNENIFKFRKFFRDGFHINQTNKMLDSETEIVKRCINLYSEFYCIDNNKFAVRCKSIFRHDEDHCNMKVYFVNGVTTKYNNYLDEIRNRTRCYIHMNNSFGSSSKEGFLIIFCDEIRSIFSRIFTIVDKNGECDIDNISFEDIYRVYRTNRIFVDIVEIMNIIYKMNFHPYDNTSICDRIDLAEDGTLLKFNYPKKEEILESLSKNEIIFKSLDRTTNLIEIIPFSIYLEFINSINDFPMDEDNIKYIIKSIIYAPIIASAIDYCYFVPNEDEVKYVIYDLNDKILNRIKDFDKKSKHYLSIYSATKEVVELATNDILEFLNIINSNEFDSKNSFIKQKLMIMETLKEKNLIY